MFNKDRYMRLSEIEYRKHELKISLSLSISLVRKLKVVLSISIEFGL